MGRRLVAVVSYLLFLPITVDAADSLDDLVKQMSGTDEAKVLAAVDAIGELGDDAADAVPALIKTLSHDSADVRWHAARTLGSIGGEAAAPAVAALTKALEDDNAKTRAYAAHAIGEIGKPAVDAADQLIKTAFDEDPLVRRASLQALLKIDPPQDKTLPVVLEILEKGDITIIGPALATLAEQGEKAVPRLRKAMQNPQARYWACAVLADIGAGARAAVPELTEALEDESPDVRLQALMALGEIGEPAERAVPAILQRFLNDDFDNVRYAAAYALGRIAVKGDAQSALTAALDSDDEFLRTVSAWALARNNPDNKQLVARAVKLIVNAFKSEDVSVRRAAARAVVEFDVPADVVAPVLVEALQDSDPAVVSNAIEALSAMGSKALEHIDDALTNDDLRHFAVRLVVQMGPEAASAVPSLVKAIQQSPEDETDVEFIREVQLAIGRIGPAASEAVPALAKSLSSNEVEIQASAAYALGKIGPMARGGVVALRNSLKSDNPIVKLASIRALLEIQPRQPQLAIIALPLLLRAMESDQPLVQAEAASALTKLGRLDEKFLPRLKELAESDNPLVAQAAAEALEAANP